MAAILFTEMNAVIAPIRERSRELLSKPESIFEKVRNDTLAIVRTVHEWDDQFSDGILA